MPMYDFQCEQGHVTDSLQQVGTQEVQCPKCLLAAKRVWISKPPAAIGDECDFVQENGLKFPTRIRSWSEYRRLMKETGNIQAVHHVGVPGTDKSPHTSDWSKGSIDPQTMANAAALVARVTGIARSREQDQAELDDAVHFGQVGAEVVGVHVRIGNVFSGVLDPSILKGR